MAGIVNDAVCGARLSVDRYFDCCYFVELEQRDYNRMGLVAVMDVGDFDDVWGLPEDKESPAFLRIIRSVMKDHKDSIIILKECSCFYGRKKHRHHPDYSKPLEVELLCPSCHRKAHAGHKRKDFINVFSRVRQQATA